MVLQLRNTINQHISRKYNFRLFKVLVNFFLETPQGRMGYKDFYEGDKVDPDPPPIEQCTTNNLTNSCNRINP